MSFKLDNLLYQLGGNRYVSKGSPGLEPTKTTLTVATGFHLNGTSLGVKTIEPQSPGFGEPEPTIEQYLYQQGITHNEPAPMFARMDFASAFYHEANNGPHVLFRVDVDSLTVAAVHLYRDADRWITLDVIESGGVSKDRFEEGIHLLRRSAARNRLNKFVANPTHFGWDDLVNQQVPDRRIKVVCDISTVDGNRMGFQWQTTVSSLLALQQVAMEKVTYLPFDFNVGYSIRAAQF